MAELRLGIGCDDDPRLARRAERLAEALELPLVQRVAPGLDALLRVTAGGLELQPLGRGAPGPVRIDFVHGRQAHRRRFGGGRGQPLARAIGLRHGRCPRVLDATAGLGGDALVLASLGCRVDLVERSPIVAALLDDALERASQAPQLQQIAARMRLHHAEGVAFLEGLSGPERPDVVYLDPMYPHRRKSARVKKEMWLFRLLVGDDNDADRLLAMALERARYRVVVKRPIRGVALGERAPDACIRSPNTRYDLYINQGFDTGADGND